MFPYLERECPVLIEEDRAETPPPQGPGIWVDLENVEMTLPRCAAPVPQLSPWKDEAQGRSRSPSLQPTMQVGLRLF